VDAREGRVAYHERRRRTQIPTFAGKAKHSARPIGALRICVDLMNKYPKLQCKDVIHKTAVEQFSAFGNARFPLENQKECVTGLALLDYCIFTVEAVPAADPDDFPCFDLSKVAEKRNVLDGVVLLGVRNRIGGQLEVAIGLRELPGKLGP